MSELEETEDTTRNGKRFFGYKVREDQDLGDLVSFADQRTILDIIERWALEDLNLLLNHVYFRTDPMIDAVPGEPLDFTRIPSEQPTRHIDAEDVVISAEDREHFRQRLAESRRRLEERGDRVAASVGLHRVEADELYRDAMERRDREESKPIPDGLSVQME